VVEEKGSRREGEKQAAAETRSGGEPQGRTHGGAEAQAEPQADGETIRRLQAELDRLSVADHLVLMMQSLCTLALNRLGLTKESGRDRDFEQARLAIDAFKALVGVMEPVRPAEEIRAHKAVLAQLQMTYVATLDRAAGRTSPGHDAGQAGGDAAGAQEARSEETS